jgi:hypothetical protein
MLFRLVSTPKMGTDRTLEPRAYTFCNRSGASSPGTIKAPRTSLPSILVTGRDSRREVGSSRAWMASLPDRHHSLNDFSDGRLQF